MRVTLGHDTSGRPLVVDDRTLAKLRAAEARLGFTFTVVQGSWRGGSGAAASAGTHDRGGVIDLRTWNIPASIGIGKAILELRKAGLIAWHRTRAQGFDEHIHAVDRGNPDLSRDAAQQERDWERGLNGLASHGRDDGPRVNIPKDPPEDDMTPDQAKTLKQAAADAAAGRKAAEKALDFARRSLVRGQVNSRAIVAARGAADKDFDKVLADIAALDKLDADV